MEKKERKLSTWVLNRPNITGTIFFFVLLCLIFLIVRQRYQLFREGKEKELSNILNTTAKNIDQSLRNNYTIALTLALTLDDNGKPKNFTEVAKKLIDSDADILAIELVPDGVVKYIYPLKGNESALNLNLFKASPQTAFDAQKAIDTRKMYFQGPVKLVQGGIGIVGRLPLYINNKFWGFSAVVVKIETFFKQVGIDNSKYKDYRFQFSKINGITKKEEFYLPVQKKFFNQHSKYIVFPDGDWKLSVININLYDTWFALIGAGLFGFGLSFLSTYLLIRLIRKQAQLQELVNQQTSKLITTESKYKRIFDYAEIGIARINSKTGLILEVNEYLCKFLGYSEEELMGKKIKSIIYPEDLEEDRYFFKKLLSGEIRHYNKVKRYVDKNNRLIWGNVILTPLWNEGEEPTDHIVIIEDVTSRKDEEQVLVSSQKRIESLINTIDGIVWEGVFETHECTFISKKVEDILGYSVEEWKNTPDFWMNHLYEEDKDRLILYVAGNLLIAKQHDEEYRMYAKDGSIVWIRDIVTIITEPNQPLKMRGIMIDITDKKYAEVALNKSFNLVTEQNKRLLNFSHIVSHNLRSHASNIQGISTLIENAHDDVERDEMIELLKRVAGNLNETLYNLNNIVNIQTSIDIIIEPLFLNEYIINALTTQNAQILAKNATVINNVDENILVNCNKAYLESILLNLISNSLRYSSLERKPVISINSYKIDGKIVLEISDNGIGIDLAKHGDKIFGIFQKFNGNADARGFGLFLTKNQIDAMGGNIEVESELDKYTSFKIYFK